MSTTIMSEQVPTCQHVAITKAREGSCFKLTSYMMGPLGGLYQSQRYQERPLSAHAVIAGLPRTLSIPVWVTPEVAISLGNQEYQNLLRDHPLAQV